jgi:hypothetical protein
MPCPCHWHPHRDPRPFKFTFTLRVVPITPDSPVSQAVYPSSVSVYPSESPVSGLGGQASSWSCVHARIQPTFGLHFSVGRHLTGRLYDYNDGGTPGEGAPQLQQRTGKGERGLVDPGHGLAHTRCQWPPSRPPPPGPPPWPAKQQGPRGPGRGHPPHTPPLTLPSSFHTAAATDGPHCQ